MSLPLIMKKLKNYSYLLSIAFTIIFSNGLWCQNKSDTSILNMEQGFQNPPNEAKARTWWHWIFGHVSKEGITAGLETMKDVRIQEAQLFNVHIDVPHGPVSYLSEEWLDLFLFSEQEAKRLGLEMVFHNGPGWFSSGGPWVTPENAMQTVVFSEMEVKGGVTFNEKYSNQGPPLTTTKILLF